MARRRRKRSHGSGQLIPPKVPGGKWGIRVRVGGKRQSRFIYDTRDIAEAALRVVTGDLAAGRSGLPPDPKAEPKLGVLADDVLDRRKLTHRAAACDRYRWKKHLAPHFAHLRPGEVDVARIRAFIEVKLAEGVNPATIRIFVSLLSAVFTDAVEQGKTPVNPVRSLPRSVRRLFKPTHDPRTTPFIEKLEDVRCIYLDLPSPLNVAYAIGALAGLRTGEVFALRWGHVDLPKRRIHVRESVAGPLKDKDSRVVPILDALLPVLAEWKLRSGGEGRVIPPLRCDGSKVDKHTPGKFLRATLDRLGLSRPGLGWYEATRHTFASQWVLANGSIEKLKEILGHYSVVITERYAHLRPDLFSSRDLGAISLDLAPGDVAPTPLGQRLGSAGASPARKAL